jgi:hypothetical protein
MSGQLHVPAAFPPYSLDRKLGGPQSRSGQDDEKKFLFLPGVEPGRQVRSLVTVLAALPMHLKKENFVSAVYEPPRPVR